MRELFGTMQGGISEPKSICRLCASTFEEFRYYLGIKTWNGLEYFRECFFSGRDFVNDRQIPRSPLLYDRRAISFLPQNALVSIRTLQTLLQTTNGYSKSFFPINSSIQFI